MSGGARYRVALVPGDGVGPEVVAEARKVVDALEVGVGWTELDWGSEHYRREGRMMPPDGVEVAAEHDAILLGAVGTPEVPDDVTLWGLLLELRQRLDLWANVRPARLLRGIPSPLRDPYERIDILFVRENTEARRLGRSEHWPAASEAL